MSYNIQILLDSTPPVDLIKLNNQPSSICYLISRLEHTFVTLRHVCHKKEIDFVNDKLATNNGIYIEHWHLGSFSLQSN